MMAYCDNLALYIIGIVLLCIGSAMTITLHTMIISVLNIYYRLLLILIVVVNILVI